jgi:hypothetical protein
MCRDLTHRYEGGAGNMAAHVLAGLANVDDDCAVGVGCGERGQGDLKHGDSVCEVD